MSERSKRYPPELRDRAVRMVLEHQHEYSSQWAAITSIAAKFGPTPETLRSWVRRVEMTMAVVLVSRPTNASGSRSSSVRIGSCAGRMRF
jgi:transposase-like protein